tara:strand:- start:344 stop:625 length:282 start_codon:yes stop_codon:yes gene_type:complete
LGYPFHPQRKPDTLRVEHLLRSHKPGLIVQASRDALGCYEEVLGYQLPHHIKLSWLAEMDHSFKPFKASQYSQASAIEKAAVDLNQWFQTHLK